MERLVRKGKHVEALDTKPELFPDLQMVWEAFVGLHRTRSAGFGGPLPLPLSEIQAWTELYGVDKVEDRIEFFELVGVLDQAWLEHSVKETSTKEVKKNGNTPPRYRRSGR